MNQENKPIELFNDILYFMREKIKKRDFTNEEVFLLHEKLRLFFNKLI